MIPKVSKPKILFVSESSYSHTGFGKYYHNVISRLYQTRKYDIAEFASYATIDNPKNDNIPWSFYPNAVIASDPRHSSYVQNSINQFGAWRLEKVLLHFQPDIVFSCRDFWYDTFIGTSPLRPFFHFCWMPTCDSVPIDEDWLEHIIEADSLFAYNDWSGNEMVKASGGKANYIGSAPPGIDITTFSPAQNKVEQKKKCLFDPEINLIGMVSRNQSRKLYPDLFIAFDKFLKLCREKGRKDLADNTYLFCHVSYPDIQPWNIPLLLKELSISHKVLFSYICTECGLWFPSLFSDVKKVCPECDKFAVMPNVEVGVNEEQLAEIYKCLDVYVQYATCEGFGLPNMEAAACGIHTMGVDYSATSDVIFKTCGTPLKIQKMFRDIGVGSLRAHPDNDYTAEQLFDFFCMPENERKAKEKLARIGVLNNYTWDRTANILDEHFSSIQLKNLQGKWNHPPRFVQPVEINMDKISKMDNWEFVKFVIGDILGRKEDIYKHSTLHLLAGINHGVEVKNKKMKHIGREEVLDWSQKMANQFNEIESVRMGLKPLHVEDFMEYSLL